MRKSQVIYSGYFDEHGKAVERNPHTHPNNYDGFVTWRTREEIKDNEGTYSDRLRSEHPETWTPLLLKHFGKTGDYWDNREPEEIEAFLREYLNLPNLKLVFIMQYCHQQSSYPYWRFGYNKMDNEKV